MEEEIKKLPRWATPPRHSKEVIATERGWMVKATGEILVSMPRLLTKLTDAGYSVVTEETEDTSEQEVVVVDETVNDDSTEIEVEQTEDQTDEGQTSVEENKSKRKYSRKNK